MLKIFQYWLDHEASFKKIKKEFGITAIVTTRVVKEVVEASEILVKGLRWFEKSDCANSSMVIPTLIKIIRIMKDSDKAKQYCKAVATYLEKYLEIFRSNPVFIDASILDRRFDNNELGLTRAQITESLKRLALDSRASATTTARDFVGIIVGKANTDVHSRLMLEGLNLKIGGVEGFWS